MKKQLLIGTALFAAISAFPQLSRNSSGYAGVADARKDREKTIGANETRISPMSNSGQINSNNSGRPAAAPTAVNWALLTGSSNTYGMLVGQSRPLQYHPALNTVSFVHRKSDYYNETPSLPSTAKTGVILANISTDLGNTWDSTCIWSDATNWGRYPQGAIYNPPGNTSLANAYIVGTGPTVSGSSFTGNFYASKKLNVLNSTASAAAGAQQFLSFTLGSYPPNQPPHGWMRCGFSATDDGIVRGLGVIQNDNTTLGMMRGYAVATGTFNAGTSTFDWRIDTLIPNSMVDGTGEKNLNPDGQMAWNQQGTIGYVVGIGVANNATLCNRGFQPVIFKMDRTTNANATWTLMPGIDFNATAMRPVVKSSFGGRVGMGSLQILGTDTVGVPFFNDFDIAVDANNKLHIGATFWSSASDSPDSLNFLQTFTTTINPSEKYGWRMVAGSRPYLYDFYGDGSTFNYALVDSISTEGPSSASGGRGYNENPWDNTGTSGAKVSMDTRIQMGRTPDGKNIYYSWAESDTLFTNNQFKWNNLPDIKVRCMAVHNGTNTNAYEVDLGPEQNMTASDNNVRTRATLHYMSPTGTTPTITPGTGTIVTHDIFIPFTVTNSNPYSQLTNNATWFGAGKVQFRFRQAATGVGIAENAEFLAASNIYPNPAQNAAVISFGLEKSATVEVTILNTVGQAVRVIKSNGNVGENAVRLDLSGLSTGIYLVNIKAGSATTTKKLIVE